MLILDLVDKALRPATASELPADADMTLNGEKRMIISRQGGKGTFTRILLAFSFLLMSVHLANVRAEGGESKFRTASIYTDNMVLQRQKPVYIRGWSRAGDRITVSFANQSKNCTANEQGEWIVKLDTMEASKEGRTLTV